MAKFKCDGLDLVISEFSSFAQQTFVKDALKQAAPTVEKEMKREISSHHKTKRDRTRGQLAASVKTTGPKQVGSEWQVEIAPSGTDSKGVRNAEKLAYLEYGTSKQTATPVVTPVVARTEDRVVREIQTYIEKKLEKLSI